MAATAPSAAGEAHRLMQAGRLDEALVFAERAVAVSLLTEAEKFSSHIEKRHWSAGAERHRS